MFKLRRLRIRRAEADAEAAESQAILMKRAFLPSMTHPIEVYLEGRNWVCTLPSYDPSKMPPKAYGCSPSQAVENFDHLWLGSPDFLIDQEEEEEEF